MIAIINAAMFGTPSEPGEYVDWSTPDVHDEIEWFEILGVDVATFAEDNPHMIVWDDERLACPNCGSSDRLYSAERLWAHYPIADDGKGGWDYTGGESKVFDETAEHQGIWCDDCNVQTDAAGGTDPGTPSSSPGRDYTIGCPVTITLNDDGSVSVVVYLGEAGEGVADDVDYDDFGREIPNPHQDDDVARIMAAIDAGHVTTTHSKGA